MTSSNRVTPFKDLENYVTYWQKEDLIFSYELNCSVTPAGLVLTLQQQQTGFSLAITIQPSPECLRISSFTLAEKLQLEDLSQPLYDAALIEMVLQGLNLIAFCAQRFGKQEINFMLTPEEADHLSALKQLFLSISSHITTAGKRQLLTLFMGDDFFETMASMKMQVCQKLWTHQKQDMWVRKYFQSINHNKRMDLKILWNRSSQAGDGENVIAFPTRSSHQAVI
ncbi:MAG: hypothetical protein K0M45_06970 [Candidatus Paracaedibacteraceae bacterium]|nr:hypothetical protein [Candidatus Paracaedibacteraceae bacterium]